jgi:hypothetical protein
VAISEQNYRAAARAFAALMGWAPLAMTELSINLGFLGFINGAFRESNVEEKI